MQELPILYSFIRCPYAMRARVALSYSNIKCELREVNLKNKPDALLKASPKGTVPVLQLPDGRVIDQSLDIIYYSLEQSDPNYINNINPEDKKVVDQLIEKNDKVLVPLLKKYKYFERHPEESQESYREQIELHFLQQMDTRLELFPYLIGEKPSVADIAIFPFVRQFAHVNPDWFYASNYKFLIAWLERFTNHRCFEMIMQKNLPWCVGDAPVIFPTEIFKL